MASVDETPVSPLSVNNLYQSLQRAGKAAHDAFAREEKSEDDQKTLEHAISIMVALRKQAPFKGTKKTKRDLQGVLKFINGLEMSQGDWVQDLWKKSDHRCKPKSGETRKQHKPVSQDRRRRRKMQCEDEEDDADADEVLEDLYASSSYWTVYKFFASQSQHKYKIIIFFFRRSK
jgi:hypothetical protein